ncbi:MAG: hypothetical protein WBW85_13585, partial [Terriglobales bacterium]
MGEKRLDHPAACDEQHYQPNGPGLRESNRPEKAGQHQRHRKEANSDQEPRTLVFVDKTPMRDMYGQINDQESSARDIGDCTEIEDVDHQQDARDSP